MLETISQVIQEKCGFRAGEIVLLGVSGGPDSLCLLEVMRQQEFPLVVAHLDHGLRGESADEQKKIELIAIKRGLPFVTRSVDVAGFAAANHLSIEEAARDLRYRFLFEEAEKTRAQAVAVGHTADDQVETVLMHLLRGAGATGLGGMAYYALPNEWSTTIALVRPLLGIWRGEISLFLREQKIEPSNDLSNQDYRFFRNRLRGETIPYLDSLISGVRRRLWQTGEILRADDTALEQLASQSWAQAILTCSKDHLVIDGDIFSDQGLAIQRRLLRRAIKTLRPGARDISYEVVERGVALAASPAVHGSQVVLAGNLRMWREGKQLWLAKSEARIELDDKPALELDYSAWLGPQSVLELPNSWKLESQALPAMPGLFEAIQMNQDKWQAWLDLERLSLPLLVRGRRSGDRLRPLGMGGGSQKLSDFMINAQTPRRLRDRWPLVLSGEEIAWLPGYCISEYFAVRSETQRLLHLRLKRERPAL